LLDPESKKWPPKSLPGMTKIKVQELACVLRGKAQSWWDSLPTFQVNKDEWVAVKASFLTFSVPKHSTKAICSKLQDLMLKPGDNVCI
jgi:hypothetical protein